MKLYRDIVERWKFRVAAFSLVVRALSQCFRVVDEANVTLSESYDFQPA